MSFYNYSNLITINQVIFNLHQLAKRFNFKSLYLYDIGTKNISLVRKLGGRSFYYEKYGYTFKNDDKLQKIQTQFDNFCNTFNNRESINPKEAHEIILFLYCHRNEDFCNMANILYKIKFYRDM